MNELSLSLSPYKGLIPYSEEDAPFFFGREQKREIITDNLMASRLTILYGSSGVGKTSVLRAGVAYHLRRTIKQDLNEHRRPQFVIVVFNSWRDDPVAELLNSIRESLAQVVKEQTLDALPHSSKLCESVHTWTRTKPINEGANPINERANIELLVILDQFEEYFLYHANEEGEGTFATEFPQVVTDPRLSISFLISIRDDALAKLDFFKRRLPNLFDNRLSIEHLDQKAAREAIVKPLQEYNRRVLESGAKVIEPEAVEAILAESRCQVGIESTLVEAILEQVRTGQVLLGRSGRGMVDSSTGPSSSEIQVETPYLQLVLSRLWEAEIGVGSRVMRLETLNRLGGASRIVQTHLDKTMNSLLRDEQAIAAGVFYHLVTPSGTKIAHTISDLASFVGLPQGRVIPVLAKLSNPGRILRPVAGPTSEHSAQRYEIFHDVLAPAILDWRVRYIHEQRQAEAEKEAAEQAAQEQKARATRHLRWLTVALAVMSLLALVAMGFALSGKSEAESSARAAAEAQSTAVEARKLAEKRREVAEEQTRLADDRKEIADLERKRAESLRLLAVSRAAQAISARDQHAHLINQIKTYMEGEALKLATQGNLSKAIEIYDRLLPIYQKTGITQREVEVLTISARLYRSLGQDHLAEKHETLLKVLLQSGRRAQKQEDRGKP